MVNAHDIHLLGLAQILDGAPPTVVAHRVAEACPTLLAEEAAQDLAGRTRLASDATALRRLADALLAALVAEAA